MENITGLIPDPRTDEQKALDYQQSEMYSASPVKWVEKTSYKTYTIRDQAQSSSCVGQGCAKSLETRTKNVESAHPIYSRRPNAPQKGMYLQAGASSVYHQGTCSEASSPSQGLQEAEMNRPVRVPTPLRVEGYGFCPIDMDSIAQMIDTHGAVTLTFLSNYQEWTDVPKVFGETKWGHCVSGVDYTLYNGEKALIVEDSWGHTTSIGNGGQRIITETYLKARCTGAMFFVNPKIVEVEKPHYEFKKDLSFGMKDPDVKVLQNILKIEGVFLPSIESTGYYGSITKKAVKALQEKYPNECLVPAGITNGVGTGYFGKFSRLFTNNKYK